MPRRFLDQRLKLSLLRAVDAVGVNGTLLKASAALGISQSALTKNLQELEDVLQVRLFYRHPRGMSPTSAGKVFIHAAQRILANVHRLEEELDQHVNPTGGTVAVGALPVAAAGVLPWVLARLKAKHPDIKVLLRQGRTTELFPLLASGELDLVVGRLYEPLVPDGFKREALWSEPISLVARNNHPIFRDGMTLQSLSQYDLILPTASQRLGQEIEHLLEKLGLEPIASLRSSSYDFIREMLYGTDAISVMPRLVFLGDLLRGRIRVAPLPVPAPDRPAGLLFPRDRALPPAAKEFVSCLRGCIHEIVIRDINPMTDRNEGAEDEVGELMRESAGDT
jgi:LysR family transcriptional regulator, pca operon transcriptional activator